MAKIHPDILKYWATEPDRKATDDELAELERLVGMKLPKEYKEYQKDIGYKQIYFKNEKYKWGKQSSEMFARYDMGVQIVELDISLSYFYPIASVIENQREYTMPFAVLENVGPRIPPQMLTIGAASGRTSGQVLMNLSEKNYGSIWYWEREDATWGTNSNDKIGFLGADIFDVLERLAPYQD